MADEKASEQKTFSHPYAPYPIQLDFMNSLYETLQDSSIGIFESPTGTGKTLSLICGSMTWLRDNCNNFDEVVNTNADEPDWVLQQVMQQQRDDYARNIQELTKRLAHVRSHNFLRDRDPYVVDAMAAGKRLKSNHAPDERSDRGDFVLPEYFEGESEHHATSIYSTEVTNLLRQIRSSAVLPTKHDKEDFKCRKIIFASRTHSQLSQFVAELRKVTFPPGDVHDLPTTEAPVRHIGLASRKNLCIHPSISQLPLDELNETCIELQDTKIPVSKRCQYLHQDDSLRHKFRDHSLANIVDIEDMAALGRKLGVCPYYTSRLAVPESEIITIPYPLLLNRQARQSLGLEVKGNIVIIDEAHNLIDAVNDIHSTVVRLTHLASAREALEMYTLKYVDRLSGLNKTYLHQLGRLIKGLTSYLEAKVGEGEVTVSDLTAGGGDAINVHEISKYMKKSKLARKIESFVDHQVYQQGTSESLKAGPVFDLIQRFLHCLINPSHEGQFFYETSDSGVIGLKYMLLNPAYAFSDIVKEARSVVLAGGTMTPMSDFINILFPSASKPIKTFSCGHVVPPKNILAMTLGSGPAQVSFDFTFANRRTPRMLQDLGRAILNLIATIPDGVVVFFPSYDYLEHVMQVWTEGNILIAMKKRKLIFTESRATKVDEMLREYSLTIDSCKGAVLFAVVGGKLSEGINFSDRLGRAVLMVGLPFPNANSAEWKAKIAFVVTSTTSRLIAKGSSQHQAAKQGKEAGQDYYVNVALRAVNQSIGRAIRHKADYAAIVLIDNRFNQENIRKRLPLWIGSGLVKGALPFRSVMQRTASFFKEKKECGGGLT